MAERDEQAASGGTKSPVNAGIITTLPHDEDAIAQVLAPVRPRIDSAARTVQAVILTADGDDALAFARAALAAGDTAILPATSEGRALRLLKRGESLVIAGTPTTLAALMRQSALKLEHVRSVIVAWGDAILAAGEADALETVMSEMPKDASRTLVTSGITPQVEELAERYFRRAHRLTPPPPAEGLAPVAMSYVTVTPLSRPASLRRVLDELDPPSVAIHVRTDATGKEARDALRELGYSANDPNVTVVTGAAPADISLIVLYDLPQTADALRTVVGAGTPRVVAFARPRDLPRLGTLAQLAPTPLPTREATARALRDQEAMRDELRAEMRRGIPARQIVALEPLLDEFDGIEVAGAALRLLERARERASVAAAAATASAPSAQPAAFTRLFMTVGTRDNIAPGDLVGMITAEAGITSAQIGKIDIRDNHSLVEIAAPVAEQVVAKVSGSAVKGRRIVARLERSRDERAARETSDRPRGRDDAARGRDSRPRGDFDRPRSRPEGDRGSRPPHRGTADRGRPAGGDGGRTRRDAPPGRDRE